MLDAEIAAGPGRGRARGGGDREPRGPDARSSWPTASRPTSSSAPARPRSTWPRTASAGTPCASAWASPSRRAARPSRWTRPWPWRTRSAIPCSCARATCSAAGPWRSSTTTSASTRVVEELARSLAREGGVSRRAARAGRPVPGGRRRGRRRRACATRTGEVLIAGVMEHVEEAGRALGGLGLRAAAPDPAGRRGRRCSRRHTRAIAEALEVVGPINVQYAVKDGAGLRARGQPARQSDGALRGQGHRRAGRHGRGPGDGGRHAGGAAGRGPAAPARRPAAG